MCDLFLLNSSFPLPCLKRAVSHEYMLCIIPQISLWLIIAFGKTEVTVTAFIGFSSKKHIKYLNVINILKRHAKYRNEATGVWLTVCYHCSLLLLRPNFGVLCT